MAPVSETHCSTPVSSAGSGGRFVGDLVTIQKPVPSPRSPDNLRTVITGASETVEVADDTGEAEGADEDARGPARNTSQVLSKVASAAVRTVPIQVARRFHQGG